MRVLLSQRHRRRQPRRQRRNTVPSLAGTATISGPSSLMRRLPQLDHELALGARRSFGLQNLRPAVSPTDCTPAVYVDVCSARERLYSACTWTCV
jgi:hypothetical protein